jgi:hypothetical protein
MTNFKPPFGWGQIWTWVKLYFCNGHKKTTLESTTQKCNCFHSPSPQSTTSLLIIQGNIVRHGIEFPSTHIYATTPIPITKTS